MIEKSLICRDLSRLVLFQTFAPGFPRPSLLSIKNTGESMLLTRIHPCCREQLIVLRVEFILLEKKLIL